MDRRAARDESAHHATMRVAEVMTEVGERHKEGSVPNTIRRSSMCDAWQWKTSATSHQLTLRILDSRYVPMHLDLKIDHPATSYMRVRARRVARKGMEGGHLHVSEDSQDVALGQVRVGAQAARLGCAGRRRLHGGQVARRRRV